MLAVVDSGAAAAVTTAATSIKDTVLHISHDVGIFAASILACRVAWHFIVKRYENDV